MTTKRVSKREARNLYRQKKPLIIGYKEHNGEGAAWDVSQFKPGDADFDEFCAWFTWRYQLGTRGTVPYPIFYVYA